MNYKESLYERIVKLYDVIYDIAERGSKWNKWDESCKKLKEITIWVTYYKNHILFMPPENYDESFLEREVELLEAKLEECITLEDSIIPF